MARAIMIQGTGSDVGKSLLVAGLARAFRQDGLRVRPFKPQNMSNNAAVIQGGGGEIGRAQALQARAAGVAPSALMNPVLLKPESERGAQVVLLGQKLGRMSAREYQKAKPRLAAQVLSSFHQLAREADLVLVEGAGSPAEVNLRRHDLANMGFAQAAKLPVVLVGDVDRGGVIAQLVGTHAVLDSADRTKVCAFLINKFRGDPGLFDEATHLIEAHTGWPSLGLIPWFAQAGLLPAEDAAGLDRLAPAACSASQGARLVIAVPRLPRIANFDDLDPLRAEPSVDLRLIAPGTPLPAEAGLVLLPGSKSTIADLAFFRDQGWEIDLRAHLRRGGHVWGLCGGYQMLGRAIHDPGGLEGPPGRAEGLGLLEVETWLEEGKHLRQSEARCLRAGHEVRGYEIHLGRTEGADHEARALFALEGGGFEGAQSRDGRVKGSYLHGVFASDAFRRAEIAALLGHAPEGALNYEHEVERILDALADHLRSHVDLPRLLALAQEVHAPAP